MPASTIRQASKDLRCLSRAELERDGGLGLQASDGAAEFEHGFGFVHDLALVNEVFHPVIRGLDLASHVGELETDDGVVDEFLAEGFSLVGIFDGFLVADPGEANALDDDAHALVIEICHDDCDERVSLSASGLGEQLS